MRLVGVVSLRREGSLVVVGLNVLFDLGVLLLLPLPPPVGEWLEGTLFQL